MHSQCQCIKFDFCDILKIDLFFDFCEKYLMENSMDQYFYKALKHCYSESNFKTQKELAITADVALSSINEAFQEKKAGVKVQMKVANAFGYELLDFLYLGRSLDRDEKIASPNPDAPEVEIDISMVTKKLEALDQESLKLISALADKLPKEVL